MQTNRIPDNTRKSASVEINKVKIISVVDKMTVDLVKLGQVVEQVSSLET